MPPGGALTWHNMAPKTKSSRKKKRRPGYPRKTSVPNRITLRLDEGLFTAMDKLCAERNITQREAVEDALRDEFTRPSEIPPGPQPTGSIRRTGMWIDPALVVAMDDRLDNEGITQRALLERAVRRWLDEHAA